MKRQRVALQGGEYDEDWDSRGDGTRLSPLGRKRLRQVRADTFRCQHCSADVPMDAVGSTQRNHCPYCLWSRHVDESVGDRKATCQTSMEPVAISLKGDGEVTIVHACCGCDKVGRNRISADDDEQLILKLVSATLTSEMEGRIRAAGIEICRDDRPVRTALFGKSVA